MTPPRLHLFEWEDLPWLPRRLRDHLTELLRHQAGTLYAPALPVLGEWLRRSGCASVVDFFSGAGGPWPRLHPLLAAQGIAPEVVLTDKYPYRRGAAADGPAGHVHYRPQPLTAADLAAGGADCATVFTGLHHLRPAAARAFLGRVAEQQIPLAVFEFTERRWGAVAGMILSPLTVWAETPAIEPFRWSRILWTYLIPAIPLLYLWDGMVSHLRTYTAAELEAMTAGLAAGYGWQAGTITPAGRRPLTYLLGAPTQG